MVASSEPSSNVARRRRSSWGPAFGKRAWRPDRLRIRPVTMRSFNTRNLSAAEIERKSSICTFSAAGWVSLGGIGIAFLMYHTIHPRAALSLRFRDWKWIPAFAGMTGRRQVMPLQTTPPPASVVRIRIAGVRRPQPRRRGLHLVKSRTWDGPPVGLPCCCPRGRYAPLDKRVKNSTAPHLAWRKPSRTG